MIPGRGEVPLVAGMVVAVAVAAVAIWTARPERLSSPRASQEVSGLKNLTTAGGGPGKDEAGPAISLAGGSAVKRFDGATLAARVSTNRPEVGQRWSLTVTAHRDTAPLGGRVSLDVLFLGSRVGHIATGRLRSGVFRHVIRWPEAALHRDLEVLATVAAAGRTHGFSAPVRVRR